MSTTSQPTSFSDLYTDLQNRLHEATGVTATANQAKRSINTALQDMHIGFDNQSPWAERDATLITNKPYSTGTVSVTNGSTTVAGTATAWTSANSFGTNNARTIGKIVINGEPEVYTISAVGGATSITLNERFVGATDGEASYEYFEDEYALASDFLRPLDIKYFDKNREVPIVGRNEFRRRYPRNKTPGTIKVSMVVDRPASGNVTPIRRILFHPPPNDFILIPYTYITSRLAITSTGTTLTSLTSDSDEPIVPLRYRHAIVLHALYNQYRDDKDDDRAQAVKEDYTQLMLRISGDHEVGTSRPQIRPRVSHYVRAAQRPYSGRGGRKHTLGSAFDEIRE